MSKFLDNLKSNLMEILNSSSVRLSESLAKREIPFDALSGISFQGVNALNLLLASFNDPRWYSEYQIKKLNDDGTGKERSKFSVKEGQRGTVVAFNMKMDKITNEAFNPNTIKDLDDPLEYIGKNVFNRIKYFTLFNAEQINGLGKYLAREYETTPTSQAIECIIQNPNAKSLVFGGTIAKYDMEEDKIWIPEYKSFKNEDEFNATVIREIVRASGHSSKLDRFPQNKTKEAIAKEELIVDIASLFVKIELDLKIKSSSLENKSNYEDSWKESISSNNNWLTDVIAKAKQASSKITEQYKKIISYEDGGTIATMHPASSFQLINYITNSSKKNQFEELMKTNLNNVASRRMLVNMLIYFGGGNVDIINNVLKGNVSYEDLGENEFLDIIREEIVSLKLPTGKGSDVRTSLKKEKRKNDQNIKTH